MIMAAAFWLGARNNDDDAWVQHSFEVQAQLTRVLSLVQSTETGQRGYLLTGRDIYLGPYRVAVEQLPRMLDRTRDLLSDDSRQMQSLAQLRSMIGAKLDELRSTIEAHDAGRQDEALAIVDNDSGFRLMQQIRQQIAAMQETENTLLGSRQEAAERSAMLLQIGVALAFLLICGVGLLIARFTRDLCRVDHRPRPADRVQRTAYRTGRPPRGRGKPAPAGAEDGSARPAHRRHRA